MPVQERQHVPDILECLAQLSSDEVPTPPKLANAMLDLLPDEVWTNPHYRWCDPCSKSGVFLREIAKRLLFAGLVEWEPDFEKRREHIFRNQLFGCAITELTGIVSRRTVYCSRHAANEYSVVRMDSDEGNIPFVPAEHDFNEDGRCTICGAPEDLERGPDRENYAYAFIHNAYPTEEMGNMTFDVIVGNPPYQIGVDGNTRTRAIYPEFVLQAMAMNPRHLVMITPSRWFTGGANLNEMRDTLLADRRMEALVDYPKLYDCFPGVKLRGGVSYFHWNREYDGPCAVQTMWDGKPTGPPVKRDLGEYDVFVRRNEAVEILRKVRALGDPTLDDRVLSFNPFGFQTNHHGVDEPSALKDPVEFYGSKKVSWMERDAFEVNGHLVGHHKLLLHRAYGEDGDPPFRVTAAPKVVGADTACSGTYLVIATSPDAETARHWGAYARTRFFRFLVSLRMNTQDLKRGSFAFVPDLPMDREWTDTELYRRYGLTEAEIDFVESQVKEMPAPEPATA
jgi:site-specific DNA-methyltransferase (adenine-specific)